MLLRFGAVHTCRVVPVPSPEVLGHMSAKRIADQEGARKTARAIVGHNVDTLHSLHILPFTASLTCDPVVYTALAFRRQLRPFLVFVSLE